MAKTNNLIQKTSKSFLLTGLVLIVLSSIPFYFYTKNILKSEVEEELYSTEARIVDAIKNGKNQFSLPPLIEVKKVNTIRPKFLIDTIIFDPSQKEMELFRELSTFETINNQKYQITIRDLVVESKDILIAIVASNILIFFMVFIFLFYFNTARSLKMWKPFFYNLEQMKAFSLASNKPLQLMDSNILEFSELKDEITQLTNKVKSDYENLKQFTEDVSHELQTPLAIIQAKIESFIDQSAISNEQYEQLTSIQKDIQRLKQFNKKLTLLTKIDNNQFFKIEEININTLVHNIIENFKELSFSEISMTALTDLIVVMDAHLAEILCNNLLSNAVKYTVGGQEINVILNEDQLIVSNYGKQALLHPDKLFQRFYRENTTIQSTGLGLAIVKKICDYYEFPVQYEFKQNRHYFSVTFK